MRDVEFIDPPPIPERPSVLTDEIKEALDARPGEWALVATLVEPLEEARQWYAAAFMAGYDHTHRLVKPSDDVRDRYADVYLRCPASGRHPITVDPTTGRQGRWTETS